MLESRTLNVRIPKGVREGQFIRLAGQGSPAWAAGRPATCCWRSTSSRTGAFASMAATCT